VREKEGIRTPFTVNENEIITKRAEVGRVGCELLSTQILGPDIAFHWSESGGIHDDISAKSRFLNVRTNWRGLKFALICLQCCSVIGFNPILVSF